MLLVEAAQTAVRNDQGFAKNINTVAMRNQGSGEGGGGTEASRATLLDATHQKAYPEIARVESSPRVPLVDVSADRSIDWALSLP